MYKTLSLLILISVSSFAFDHTHGKLDKVLQKHVKIIGNQSLFDYKALKLDVREFEKYLFSLSTITKLEFNSFSNEQRLALLINTYNAFTIKIILDNYLDRAN